MRALAVGSVVTLLVLSSVRLAAAEGLVLESYTGSRPAQATALLAPVHEELAVRGYMLAETFGRSYRAHVSQDAAPVGALAPTFDADVERGHRAWVNGKFDEALGILVPLIARAHASSAEIAHAEPLRAKLLKALIAVVLSHQRKGDIAAAKATIGEILRSYPDAQVARASYGPDAYRLFEEVRLAATQSRRGRLTVEVPSEQAVVFINERYETVGRMSRGDLMPGEYRVHAQLGQRPSRLYRVVVRADEETKLTIDAGFDEALATTSWSGFLFKTAADRKAFEAGYAARVASEVGASAAVILGVEERRGELVVVGSVIDPRTARELRRLEISSRSKLDAERVRTFARSLAGDPPASQPEERPMIRTAQEPTRAVLPFEKPAAAPPPSGRAWMRWTGIAAIGVGAIGGGLAIKFAGDEREKEDEIDRVCAVSCSSGQLRALQDDQQAAHRNAVIAGIAGGALVVTGVILVITSRAPSPARTTSVSLGATDGGFGISYAKTY